MKESLFFLADLWMIFAGLFYGVKFIRRYGNYLLGLEWIVIGTSGTNFLLWALLGGDEQSPMYFIAYFLDAFSRSVGVTLIVVLGLMRVTHRYKPSVPVDVGAFALAAMAGLYLQQFHHKFHAGSAIFYVVVGGLTALFVLYFTGLVWAAGSKLWAIAMGIVTAAGLAIVVTYDFFPIPGDDQHGTIFYILALATWGTQMFVTYHAYRAVHDHNVATGVEPAPHQLDTMRALPESEHV